MKIYLPLITAIIIYITGIAGIGECQHRDIIGADAWYNWSPDTALECKGFIPMVRDAQQITQLQEGLLEMQRNSYLLSFNEPDNCPYQACISPLDAPPLEKWILDTYDDTQHVSPAPSQENIQWLPQMRNAYIAEYGNPPAWDYLAAHCYFWSDESLAVCKSIITQYITWADEWGAEGVMVTEFASIAFRYEWKGEFEYDPAVERGRDFIQWMDAQEEIKTYFWFSAKDWFGVWDWYVTTALFDEYDELTPLGDMLQEEYNAVQ